MKTTTTAHHAVPMMMRTTKPATASRGRFFITLLTMLLTTATAWATDYTVTYNISYTSGTVGANRHGHITRADNPSLTTEWNHGTYGVLWPANEVHGVDDEYDITFKPNYELDSKEVNDVKSFATESVKNSSSEGTTFTVTVGATGYYIKSVTFKNSDTQVATASNTPVANSSTLNVLVAPEKFFTRIVVELTDNYYALVTPGSGLTVTSSPSLSYNNKAYYLAGSTVTLAPTNASNIVENVSGVDGATIATDKRSFSFTMPTKNVSPAATLTEVHTLSVPDGITVSAPYTTIQNIKYYKTGVSYTLTVTDAHKAFNNDFSVNGTGASFTMATDQRSAAVTIGTADAAVTTSLRNFAYTVVFNGNGSTGGTMNNQAFEYSIAQNLTANGFNRTGYTFAGWANEADGAVVYGDQVSVINLTATDGGTVNLYAKWTPNTYTVHFNGNGSTSGTMSDMNFTYDVAQNLTANGFNRTGYTFAGWANEADGAVVYGDQVSVINLTTTNNATVTLYAKWTANTYTVHFDKNHNDATGEMSDMPFTYDIAQTLTANAFSRAHYDFAGWNTQTDGNGANYNDQQSVENLTATDKGTVNLYAQWTLHIYTISYDLAGGSVATANPATYTVESSNITLTNPTRTGYVFMGWTGTGLDAATMSVTIANGSSGDRSYTATWEPVAFSVHFNGNGATSGTMSNQEFAYDRAQLLTANAFGRAFTVTYNYNDNENNNENVTATATYNGWATSANGAVVYADQQSVSNLTNEQGGIVDLYANWTDASVTLPTPTRTGYTFVEWCSDEALTTKVGDAGEEITPSTDLNLYAHWILNTSIDVTFTSPITAGDDAYITVTMTPTDISLDPNPITTVALVNVHTNVGTKPYFVPIVNGVGTCIVTNLAANTYDIRAVFDGDDQYKASTSEVKQLTVENIPTTLTISVDKMTAYVGDPVTVTVELEPQIDACVTVCATDLRPTFITGSYNFTLALVKGRGTMKFSHFPASTRYFSAAYAGDDIYLNSYTEAKTVTITQTATTTNLSATPEVMAK